MDEKMGYDARAEAALELRNALMAILETRGMISTTIDVATADYIVGELSEIILMRESGMRILLDALLEGDFHLEGLSPLVEDPHFRKSLFIPYRSIAKAIGSIDIEREPGRDGYVIRRKS